jgi:pimeloyl-ACP methyl ester carboxylesterase
MNRDREISLVMCGKKMQIIHTNIPKAFAIDNIDSMKSEISKAKSIASQCNDDGIIALLNGMKQRKDHSKLLSKTPAPVLVIWGEKDNYIGESVFKKLIELAPHAGVIVLKNSGHMGFIEEADYVAAGILSFLDSLK